MDVPVQITMIALLIVNVIFGSLIAKNTKHWTDILAILICFLFAAFIAYGLYIQCDSVVVFYRCGG